MNWWKIRPTIKPIVIVQEHQSHKPKKFRNPPKENDVIEEEPNIRPVVILVNDGVGIHEKKGRVVCLSLIHI